MHFLFLEELLESLVFQVHGSVPGRGDAGCHGNPCLLTRLEVDFLTSVAVPIDTTDVVSTDYEKKCKKNSL